MTTLSRRALTLALATASALTAAAPAARRAAPALAQEGPTGWIVAVPLADDGLEAAPGLLVVDPSDGEETLVDTAAIGSIFPVAGTAYAVATSDRAVYVVDAADASATEVRPWGDSRLGDDFLDPYPLLPYLRTPSDRYAVLSEGSLPRWLIDLADATAVDLIDTFAGEDRLFQLAGILPGDRMMILGSGDVLVRHDLATLAVERTFSESGRIAQPQLSPDRGRLAWVERTDGADRSDLMVADAADDAPAELALSSGDRTPGFRWVDERTLLLTVLTGTAGMALSLLDLATGEETQAGIVPAWARGPEIVANGTRALAAGDEGDGLRWRLVDLTTGDDVAVPELDGLTIHGEGGRASRALVFGPESFSSMVEPGERYAVLNTATGAITTSVARAEGQFYAPVTVAPGGRSAAIGRSGDAGEELWLIDLVDGALTTLRDHLGATFSPDGRHVLTREVGPGNPFTVRRLTGDVVRELGRYDRAVWVGR